MDLGVYGVSLAVELSFREGQQATIHTSIDLDGPQTASIVGTTGRIDIDRSWFMASGYTVMTSANKVLERRNVTANTYGLQHEAAEVERLIEFGPTESLVMPHSQTLEVLAILEQALDQSGVRFSPSPLLHANGRA
jgi:hypothetical protein